MGLIRLLLSIAVVVTHTGTFFGLRLTGGVIAVQSFYMISGFYMTLVLSEKYKNPNSLWLFWSKRILRLWPVYFVTLLFTLSISKTGTG